MDVIRFTNSVFESNTYLIKDDHSENCYMIDCGDVEAVVQYLQKKKITLQAVFITHTHYDHIYGLNKLCELYTDITIYTSFHGKEGVYSDKLNLSKYHLVAFVFRFENIEILRNGQEAQLFDNLILRTYETPGHDWSSLCYKVGNAFFSGDSYLPQYSLVANFPKSNKKQALDSLEWIRKLSIGCNIYPGHRDIVYV